MGGLDLEILLHHRCDARIGVRSLRSIGGQGRGSGQWLDRHGRRKLANFVHPSYRFAASMRVFHARRRRVRERLTCREGTGKSVN